VPLAQGIRLLAADLLQIRVQDVALGAQKRCLPAIRNWIG
jgi:hypothetical protein